MLKSRYLQKIVVGLCLGGMLALSFVPHDTSVANTVNNEVQLKAVKPKYVFYMIGDGLGAAQRQIAEYYLQEQTGNKNVKLTMNTLPTAGINTTHSADTLVTDSAAAGTALASGHKTNNGMIGKLPDGSDVKSILELAEAKGMGTGLVTTTRLTHATPAVFAAHNADRDDENGIAEDYLDSGVDYLAGGGYRHFAPEKWEGGKSKRKDNKNILAEMRDKGYKVFYNESMAKAFRDYKPSGKEKVIATLSYSHLPYEIDRVKEDKIPSLAELTQKGIDLLSQYDEGFFMMVEGGRIDHACHANDAPGSIQDTLAFDEAVKKAYEFYTKHPDETLIVVVGDHETGGLGMGFGENYFMKLEALQGAKVSVEDILQSAYTGDRAAYFKYIGENLGLVNLSKEEETAILMAMDKKDKGKEDLRSYGSYDPVAIATTHVLSERANIYWTTFAHSGTAIPMSAVGVNAEAFGGYKDNTEIAKTMAKIMGLELSK